MTTQRLTREQLGMRPPTGDYTPLHAQGATLHYGGPSPWPSKWGTLEEFIALCDHNRCPSIWRAWQDYHMSPGALGTHAPNHPIDIAYTSGVCCHGVRLEGRGAGHRTAAQGTNEGNDKSYAVVYLAGKQKDGRDDPLTPAAKVAFLDESAYLLQPYRWVHSDWHSTSCPGDPLYQWQRVGCPAPGVLPPTPPPLPIVPPLISTGSVYILEDLDMAKLAVYDVPVPKLGSQPDDAYWDLDGAAGRPLVRAGHCVSVRVGAADTTAGGGPGEVRDCEHNGVTRLRFREFEQNAAPTIIVTALVD